MAKMTKATLSRIGMAALSDFSEDDLRTDPAAAAQAFHIAQGAMRGAVQASISVSGPRESKGEQE